MNKAKFKPDFLSHVAGLRGIAILLVVWFHMTSNNNSIPNAICLPNGFLGVDVFLVIMGYFLLMGFKNKKEISFISFAQSKAFRILYPLSVLIILSIMVCLYFCDFEDVQSYSRTALTALWGVVNWDLIRLSKGYFVEDTSMNPFLHTWYLGVTLQTFALFYAGFAIARYCSRKVTVTLCIIVALFSFFYSQMENIRALLIMCGFSTFGPEEIVSYYATLPRIWEPLSAGLVWFLPDTRIKLTKLSLLVAGLCLIFVPAFLNTQDMRSLTILVVVGTVLVIKYGDTAPGNGLLACKPLIYLGTISFSLYLVHMPVIALYKTWQFQNPGIYASVALLIISLLLASGFYRYIEKRKVGYKVLIPLFIFATLICVGGYCQKGYKNLLPMESNQYELPTYSDWRMYPHDNLDNGFDGEKIKPEYGWYSIIQHSSNHPILERSFLQIGVDSAKPNFLLMGDSHAQHLYAGLDRVCKEEGLSGVYLDSIVCPFWNREIPNFAENYYYNQEKAEALMEWLKQHPEIKTIIIGQHWGRFKSLRRTWNNEIIGEEAISQNIESFVTFISKLREMDKRIICFYPEPTFRSKKMPAYARWLIRWGYPFEAAHPDFICTLSDYQKTWARSIDILESIQESGALRLLDFRKSLFNGGVCKSIKNNTLIYRDCDHLSSDGSYLVMKYIAMELKSVIIPSNEEQL